MIALFLSSISFLILCQSGLCQESGGTTAQSICDSKGAVGLYPDQNDISCKQYAKCFKSSNALIGAFYNCTGSTLFNPAQQLCTTGYTCTATSTTTITTTTHETTTEKPSETTSTIVTTTIGPISAQSICDSKHAAGKYPNPDDTLCKQYAKCFENNGSMVGSYFNCSGTTLFDPALQLCTIQYSCEEKQCSSLDANNV